MKQRKIVHRVLLCGILLVAAVFGTFVSKYLRLGNKGSVPANSSSSVSSKIKYQSPTELILPTAVEQDNQKDKTAQTAVARIQIPAKEEYAPYTAKIGKEKLTQGRTLYNRLEKQVYLVAEVPNSSGRYLLGKIKLEGIRLSDAQIRIAVSAFIYDHPEVFWLANEYSYTYEGKSTIVQMYSYVSASQCREMSAELSKKLGKIIEQIPQGLSPVHRELYIFNSIAQHCSYDTQAVKDNRNWKAHTMVGAVISGKAVCEGYSRTMQYLLNRVGVPCALIAGKANGGLHMWNIVRIDGNWYHVDLTWDDGEQVISYKYFNLTDSAIEKDHIAAPLYKDISENQLNKNNVTYNLWLPSCNSTKANYFTEFGVPISSFDNESDQKVIKALIEAVRAQKPTLSLFIDKSVNYEDAVEKLFRAPPYKFLYYVNQANRHKGVSVSYTGCSYLEIPQNRGVIIVLKYKK